MKMKLSVALFSALLVCGLAIALTAMTAPAAFAGDDTTADPDASTGGTGGGSGESDAGSAPDASSGTGGGGGGVAEPTDTGSGDSGSDATQK